MRFLVTGGCGFLGSNLASEVLRRGDELIVLDNLYRLGTTENLAWLKTLGKFQFIHGDVRAYGDVENAIRNTRPDVVFHLAGQVAMTTSIENPRLDFETNVVGSLNILESVRKFSPDTIVTYSSTNKVYGDLDQIEYKELETRYVATGHENGFNEMLPLDFRSPYGCSKGAADQYMLDYARVFGLKTVVFRHSSIFGGRQFSTADQGWVGWFVLKALEAKKNSGKAKFSISGDGKQVRDVLFASDLIDCYFSAVRHIDRARGKAFNIGGGASNSLSLLELFGTLERELSTKLVFEKLPWRQSDQKVFIADIEKAKNTFDWTPKVDKVEGIRQMIPWVEAHSLA